VSFGRFDGLLVATLENRKFGYRSSKCRGTGAMSALPPKADMCGANRDRSTAGKPTVIVRDRIEWPAVDPPLTIKAAIEPKNTGAKSRIIMPIPVALLPTCGRTELRVGPTRGKFVAAGAADVPWWRLWGRQAQQGRASRREHASGLWIRAWTAESHIRYG
jgi:hypothetical protein